MRIRTFPLLALAVTLVLGNTAIVLWLEGRPAAPGDLPARPVREDRAVLVPWTPPAVEEKPRLRVHAPPGAAVRVLPDRRAAAGPFGGEPLAEGIAGPDGICELVLAARVRARVLATLEGFAPAEAPVRGPTVVVRLAPAAEVRVRVVEEGSGRPVAGATVLGRLGDAPPVAAADGGEAGVRFLRDLAAGRWTVEASSLRNPPATTTVEVAAGGVADAEVRLRKGFTLRGRVTIPGTDRVPEEGTVEAGGRAAPLGPGGRFVLEGLEGPERAFRVRTGGAVFRSGGQAARVDPATGEQVGEVEVPLPGNNPSGLEYRGVVRDEEGRPVEGARILVGAGVLQGAGPADGRIAEGRTDAAGRYAVRLERGGREILATRPGFAPTFLVLPPRSRNRAFDLVLARGVRLLVRVTGSSGAPAEGAEVYTFLRHPDPLLSSTVGGDVQEGLGAHPLTDAAGAAVLPRMGAGSWWLGARSADGLEGARVVLDLAAGTGDRAADLRMGPLPPGEREIVVGR